MPIAPLTMSDSSSLPKHQAPALPTNAPAQDVKDILRGQRILETMMKTQQHQARRPLVTTPLD